MQILQRKSCVFNEIEYTLQAALTPNWAVRNSAVCGQLATRAGGELSLCHKGAFYQVSDESAALDHVASSRLQQKDGCAVWMATVIKMISNPSNAALAN